MGTKKSDEATDKLDKEKLISREFDDGSRDLLQKPIGREEDGSHTGYDKEGKLVYSYGRGVYGTSGFAWETLESQKLNEAARTSVEADLHRAKASELTERGFVEEAEKESKQAQSLDSQSAFCVEEAKAIRLRIEAEQAENQQRQMDLDRGR